MSDPQMEQQLNMVGIMQGVLDLHSKGPCNLLEELPKTVPDLSEDEFRDLVVTLKFSRILDATLVDGPDGKKQIESINGLTTRGLRELQKAWQPPIEQHSCPTDGDDGRMGFV